MSTVNKLSIVIVGAVFLVGLEGVAQAFTLSNAPGDGSVTVDVDGYGSFGTGVGGVGIGDATYDPVGSLGLRGTTYESGVLISSGGSRTFLGDEDFSAAPIAGTSTAATSVFTFGNLGFQLTQTFTPTFVGSSRTGSQLIQAYTITNTSNATQNFDLVRYFDGGLEFANDAGGGRLVNGGTEILFETNTATSSSTSTTFVGITSEGGTIPATNRFEIDEYDDLINRIEDGVALDDTITFDNPADSDQFIDAGRGYDVTLALRNTFSLDAGVSTNYTTSTIFGTGAPQDVTPSEPVPEPSTIFGSGLALGFWSLMRRKQSRNLKKVVVTE